MHVPHDLPAPAAVIFDLDGTLIDSAPDIAAALNHALGFKGLEPVPLPAVRGMIGDGVKALIGKALAYEGPRRRAKPGETGSTTPSRPMPGPTPWWTPPSIPA